MKIYENLETIYHSAGGSDLFNNLVPLRIKENNVQKYLFSLDDIIKNLQNYKIKYPNYQLFIEEVSSYDWSELNLMAYREEDSNERAIRLKEEHNESIKKDLLKQKKINKLKNDAAKLGLTVS